MTIFYTQVYAKETSCDLLLTWSYQTISCRFDGTGVLMNIAERLDCIRREFPECRTLAYADISTNMILSISSQIVLRQEHLNSLCNTAVEMLSGHSSTGLRDALGEASVDPEIYEVLVIEAEEVGIFLKSTYSPTDALCCLCSISINLEEFCSRAREHLDEIGKDP